MAKETEKLYIREKPECRETMAQISAFLSDSLSERELQRFLEHVRSCPQCYKELETNYMVERTITYLNEDVPSDISFDLTPLLEQELEQKTKRLILDRRVRVIRMIILVFTVVLLVLFLLDLTGLFQITVFFGQ